MSELAAFPSLLRALADRLEAALGARRLPAEPEPEPLSPTVEVGRLVPVARPGRVFVVPLTRQPDGLSAGPALELSRVPCCGEWIAVGDAMARVVAVRHLTDGAVDAQVQVDPLPAEPPP